MVETKLTKTIQEEHSGFAVYRLEKYFKTKKEATNYIGKQDSGFFHSQKETFWGTEHDKE